MSGKIDDPAVIAARLRNLTNNFNRIGFWALMEEMSFDEVVEAYWQAQRRRAERVEAEATKQENRRLLLSPAQQPGA